ncbi:hypothetical protein ACFQS1_32370 [Paractinoplanes rhizophilus]|uniref:Uncharacterized protein n=1 Tax=Paractinoplanes rhizophilus TaxID=1416877 RepID=A0ABW2I1D9_9ACTN
MAHQVGGATLRLTESGCGGDEARCEVRFRIRVPAATAVEITAQAGAVDVDVRPGVGGSSVRVDKNPASPVTTR